MRHVCQCPRCPVCDADYALAFDEERTTRPGCTRACVFGVYCADCARKQMAADAVEARLRRWHSPWQ
jgi:hypothetical protein